MEPPKSTSLRKNTSYNATCARDKETPQKERQITPNSGKLGTRPNHTGHRIKI